MKATKHPYFCSRDGDTTLGFWSFHCRPQSGRQALFILIFCAFCIRTSPVYQGGIVSIPGAKDLAKCPVHGMDDPMAAKQIRAEKCGSSFLSCDAAHVGSSLLASRPRFLSVYSGAACVSRERVLLTRTVNSCRDSGRVTPLAASAWICRYRLTPPWTDRPLSE